MKYMVFSSMLIVLATIAVGFHYLKSDGKVKKGFLKRALTTNVIALLPLLAGFVAFMIPEAGFAAETATGSANGLGLIAAGLSTGMATIGAGYAVGAVGSSALGAVSEDPKILGKTLIFVGLAEGIAIYGLIISILILGRV